MVHVEFQARVVKFFGIVLFCSQLTLVGSTGANAALVDVTGTNASGDLVMRSAELVLPPALYTGRISFRIADSRVHLPVGEPVMLPNLPQHIGPVLAGVLFLSSSTVKLPAPPSLPPVFDIPVFPKSFTPPSDRAPGTTVVGSSGFRRVTLTSAEGSVFEGNLTGTVGTSIVGKFTFTGKIGDPSSIPNAPLPGTLWLFATGMSGLGLLKIRRWIPGLC